MRPGIGWVETAFLPRDRYRMVERTDGFAIYTYDEQQAALDRQKQPQLPGVQWSDYEGK